MIFHAACRVCQRTFESDSFNTGELCPTHKAEQQNDRRARDRKRGAEDEYRKFLNSPAWRNLSALLRRQNPMCQCLGCTNPADAVHHILSGRDHPDLRLNPANLVAICDRCHNNANGDMTKNRYTPTRYSVMGIETVYSHDVAA